MRNSIVILAGLVLAAAPAAAGTFDRGALAPELGFSTLDRALARAHTGKSVFSAPYATVVLGRVDLYDVFPYVESRRFQVVSDPAWDRLVFGEIGHDLSAWDGRGSALGALDEPRGLAVDERGRLFVADTGNDRVLVFDTRTTFDRMELVPVYAIEGLHAPYGVAHSDAGTPFEPADDRLYVADTGKNRVVAFGLADRSARLIDAIGDLGGGAERFGGPMAITVGRAAGAHTSEVYVADAHVRRIVRLRDEGAMLRWVDERPVDAAVVTSLDTDRWGNVYAAAPNAGTIRKFSPDLVPVAELATGVTRPRTFHVPFSIVTDHRTGTVVRQDHPSAVLLEEWTDASGMKLWHLGVDVADLAVVGDPAPRVRFTLTDAANVTLEITDPAGRVCVTRALGTLPAGPQDLLLGEADVAAASAGGSGECTARVRAASRYDGGPVGEATARFRLAGGGVAPPSGPQLLGAVPNPAWVSTRIAYLLPQTPSGPVALRLHDVRGRLVRRFTPGTVPGLNEVAWDGRDERGARVAPGVYFVHLTVGAARFDRRLVWER